MKNISGATNLTTLKTLCYFKFSSFSWCQRKYKVLLSPLIYSETGSGLVGVNSWSPEIRTIKAIMWSAEEIICLHEWSILHCTCSPQSRALCHATNNFWFPISWEIISVKILFCMIDKNILVYFKAWVTWFECRNWRIGLENMFRSRK